jgi:hypothetical protein
VEDAFCARRRLATGQSAQGDAALLELAVPYLEELRAGRGAAGGR